ncbi:energy-coupling factor transport system ATP-binding protein [Rhizobium sp. PP-CC-3A-592]|nr:energy-coupling factor transport system ATP-binding protein [Rhizobium sp. PP-CC-3A-592]
MLKITSLRLGFGGPDPVIAETDCHLEEGQRLLICGEAGSGKTTFLAAAAGLIPRLLPIPDHAGDVTLMGRPIATFDKTELFSTIAFVSQNIDDQLWDLCVEDIIAFPLENRGVEKQAIRERLRTLIAAFGIEALCGRRVLTLSGGERRMVAIAAALAASPLILVMDEPTTGLDPAARARLAALLQTVASSVSALLVAEQDPLALLSVIDRIALLSDRHLSQPVPPADIVPLDNPWRNAGLLPPLRQRSERPPAILGRPLLEVRGLTTRLARPDGQPVLKGVDVEIRAGEVLALIGRNGAGKTTLFKAILGLEKIASGALVLDREAANSWTVAARARKIAYIPQNMRHILFNMTVTGEVIFAITAASATSTDPNILARAAAALERYGLSGFAEANPFVLSARQQALLGLACADAAGALITIVDEPLLARDLKGRRMLDLFIATLQESGRSVMLISHDLELVDDVATRMMILDDGAIAFDGALNEGWESAPFRRLGWPAPYRQMAGEIG